MPWYTFILRILFPESCVVCKKEGQTLCVSCLHTLPLFPHAPYDFIHPLFSYQNTHVHSVVHGLKYNHTQSIATILANPMYQMLQDVFKESLMLQNTDVILIPVPAMKSHVNKRGSNHVHILAQEITKCGTRMEIASDAIIRVNTKAQRTLSRRERLTNMKNAFEVLDNGKIKGRHIVIIDDVCTTGATLYELRSTCLRAGAKNVIALAIAH